MDNFKKLILVFSLLVFIAGNAEAATNYWFSPLPAIAVGPDGPPSVLSVSPQAPGPSEAIMVTASKEVEDDDFQWILIGLTIPSGASGKIRNVQIFYQVDTPVSGRTYISQVRLTKMTTPDVAVVIHDDGTKLTATTPTCYKSQTRIKKVQGTITLRLKMVFGDISDAILIGGIQLRVSK